MVTFGAESHPGYREGENEDSIGWDETAGVWLVADGMGGHVAGQRASRIACDTVLESLGERSVEDAIMLAHSNILRDAEQNPENRGMGTTIVIASVHDALLDVHWVGDSRAYLFRDGELKQVSVDHSFIEMLRERVDMTEEEMMNHPQKNLVTQILGHDVPSPSHRHIPLRAGDRILLCSDGLNDEVSSDQIAEILATDQKLGEICEQLIGRALRNGGKDNVSVVLMDYQGPSHPDADQPNKKGGGLKPVMWGIAGALLVLGLLMMYLK